MQHQLERLRPAVREIAKSDPNQIFLEAEDIRAAQEKRQLRLLDEPLYTQFTIEKPTRNNTLKVATRKRKATQSTSMTRKKK